MHDEAAERSLEPRFHTRLAWRRHEVPGMRVIDIFSRECMVIEIGQRLKGEHVVEGPVPDGVPTRRPEYLFANNGAEFTSQLVNLWARHHSIRLDFHRLGKPTDNAFVETFNGSMRDECLNL